MGTNLPLNVNVITLVTTLDLTYLEQAEVFHCLGYKDGILDDNGLQRWFQRSLPGDYKVESTELNHMVKLKFHSYEDKMQWILTNSQLHWNKID